MTPGLIYWQVMVRGDIFGSLFAIGSHLDQLTLGEYCCVEIIPEPGINLQFTEVSAGM